MNETPKKAQYDSGLMMNCFLSTYRFVFPKDIPNVEGDNYHLYMILSLPRFHFETPTIFFRNNLLTCNISDGKRLIHYSDPESKLSTNSIFSGFSFNCPYPYTTLTINYYQNFVKMNPATIDADGLYFSMPDAKKDFEVLYIGQSQGRKKNRTAGIRLESHSTLQKILQDYKDKNDDSHIVILLMNFDVDAEMMFTPNTLGYDEKIPVEDRVDSSTKHYNIRDLNNIVEAALINAFKPKYNYCFKQTNTKNKGLKTMKLLFDNKFDSLSVEMNPEHEEIPISLHTETLTAHLPNPGQIIYSLTDDGLLSTYEIITKRKTM